MTKEQDFDLPILKVREDRISELLTEVERLKALQEATAARAEVAQIEVERLKAELARIRGLPRLAALDAEVDRLTAALDLERRRLAISEEALRRALERKP